MDITAHPKLDPKLKETYDRIMGTNVGVKTPHHDTPLPHQVNASHPETKEPLPSHAQSAEHHAKPAPGHLSHIAYNAASASKKEHHENATHTGTTTIKPDSLLLPLLIGAGGVIFFVVYSIFWMRFFGL